MPTSSEEIRDAFHYLFRAELPLLKQLVQSLPPKPFVVNIGAGAGTSGLAILESRDDVTLLTLDIQNESSPFGCLEAERDVVERAGLHWKQGIHWFQIHASSVDVARMWKQGRGFHVETARRHGANKIVELADMVFVDGDHSYEGAKADIEGWMPLIKDGGIMVVHDFLKSGLQPDPDGPHPMPWPGVDSAVSELLIPNFEMIIHVASLVAFRKGVTNA